MDTVENYDSNSVYLDSHDVSQAIPLHFVGGLTASGKTSLIRELALELEGRERLGILQTEDGARPLDLPEDSLHVVQKLGGACICCEIFLVFYKAVLSLVQSGQVDRILVELPATADIQQLKMLLKDYGRDRWVEPGPTLVTVDPRNPHFKRWSAAPLVNRLIDVGDVFVLRFGELASAREMERFLGWVSSFEAGEKRYVIPQHDQGLAAVVEASLLLPHLGQETDKRVRVSTH
jgi:G3E family GTPase